MRDVRIMWTSIEQVLVKREAMTKRGILLLVVTDKVIIIFLFVYHWDSAE
jgi:hypothetical protein